ncbi:DNA methyltransferase [Octadecabacter antarcticus]|uniref:DNA methyltransferase n=1 Tax=Octadecabacter antarcticus TaxID=1217908 RepID=UPI001FDEC91C|nr:DNA methyltransferase [Octadecabacter antarcticus]
MRQKGGLGAAGLHPAVFPVALVEAVLAVFSDPSNLIYEPFNSSGTQLVAAERTGQRCGGRRQPDTEPSNCRGVAFIRKEDGAHRPRCEGM